jgi:hypothetical protein
MTGPSLGMTVRRSRVAVNSMITAGLALVLDRSRA